MITFTLVIGAGSFENFPYQRDDGQSKAKTQNNAAILSGNFLDKRIGIIEAVEDDKAVIKLEQGVEGSKLYWEYYSAGNVRKLSVCEIRVLAGGKRHY